MITPIALIVCTYESAGTGPRCQSTAAEEWSPARPAAAPQSLDDAALVERAVGRYQAAPDREAFGALYERYMPTVFAFALSKLHDPTQAEDIASQTFLQALQALPRYQQRGLPIRGWFFRIASNLIADLYRACPIATVPLGEIEEPPGQLQGGAPASYLADPYAEEAFTVWEGTEEFRHLLRDLPPAQRSVIRLRFAAGMAFAAIAAKTGRSTGAVKALQSRGIRELRRQWRQVPA